MTRRYFTCPIQALYMAKEFGVSFIVGDQGHYNYKTCLPYTIEHLSKREKFYVDKESEEIFNLNQNDLIRYKTRSGISEITATWISNIIDEHGEHRWTLQNDGKLAFGKAYLNDKRPFKIIMRNNKNFFVGELENDK